MKKFMYGKFKKDLFNFLSWFKGGFSYIGGVCVIVAVLFSFVMSGVIAVGSTIEFFTDHIFFNNYPPIWIVVSSFVISSGFFFVIFYDEYFNGGEDK